MASKNVVEIDGKSVLVFNFSEAFCHHVDDRHVAPRVWHVPVHDRGRRLPRLHPWLIPWT
eukprot:5822138-Prymnesium_polylepis.1